MNLKVIITLLTAFIIPYIVLADVSTEKEIGRIKRDKAVIWAEVRAESEQEARDEAIKQLQDKVTDYFNERAEHPDAVYISQLSSKTEMLTTHTSSNRYRVFVYVRKNELLPLNTNKKSASMVLKRDEGGYLQQLDIDKGRSVNNVDTTVVMLAIPPAVSRLSTASSFKELRPLLVELRDKGQLSHSAWFPLSDIDDYYVIAFDADDHLKAVLHYKDSKWYDALTASPVDIVDYKNYSAIWFTLKETTK